jgi:Leucine-rich repeat (LRR) protein
LSAATRALQALVELRASHNRLVSLLSVGLCGLNRLALLHVGHNQLAHLPDQIGTLPSLQVRSTRCANARE